MSNIRPSCCQRARDYDDDSMGIHHSDGEEARSLSEARKKSLRPGWHLIYDSWYGSDPIDFCPFCGKRLL
jgi:hypothetical protein